MIYAGEFNPLVSLKALAYHDDPALRDLPQEVRDRPAAAVKKVDVDELPTLTAYPERGRPS